MRARTLLHKSRSHLQSPTLHLFSIMADRREGSGAYPQWLSITGEPLDLDLPNGLLGKSPASRLPPILISSRVLTYSPDLQENVVL